MALTNATKALRGHKQEQLAWPRVSGSLNFSRARKAASALQNYSKYTVLQSEFSAGSRILLQHKSLFSEPRDQLANLSITK